jgi:hypothetical protein
MSEDATEEEGFPSGKVGDGSPRRVLKTLSPEPMGSLGRTDMASPDRSPHRKLKPLPLAPGRAPDCAFMTSSAPWERKDELTVPQIGDSSALLTLNMADKLEVTGNYDSFYRTSQILLDNVADSNQAADDNPIDLFTKRAMQVTRRHRLLAKLSTSEIYSFSYWHVGLTRTLF